MWYLILGITGISFLGWFINTVAPENLLTLAAFFIIIGGTTYAFSFFFLKIVRRSLLVTFGVLILLLLRMLGLRDFYYPLLLIPILISLEILLRTG